MMHLQKFWKPSRTHHEKRAITNHGVLNEATPMPSRARSRAACGSI
jgi:hypothetical protein